MKEFDYNALAAKFYICLSDELKSLAHLGSKGKLDFTLTYHYIHRVEQIATNAKTVLDNLPSNPRPSPSTRYRSHAKPAGDPPLTDEQINDLAKPFQKWDRGEQ